MLDFVTWCENEGWIQFGDYLVHGLCLYWGSYPVKFECEILNELVNISAFSITEEWTLETFWTKIKQAFESVVSGFPFTLLCSSLLHMAYADSVDYTGTWICRV